MLQVQANGAKSHQQRNVSLAEKLAEAKRSGNYQLANLLTMLLSEQLKYPDCRKLLQDTEQY